MKQHKLTLNKIFTTMLLMLLFCFSAFNIGETNSYLTNNGYMMGVIHVAGLEINAYQDLGSGYRNCTDTGIYLQTTRIATDQTYYYDVILKNDDLSTVVASSYYLRWKFIAKVDGEEYNINRFIETSDSKVFLNGDYYYLIDVYGDSDMLMAQESVSVMESLEFAGSYNSITDSYGSLLDSKFSGSEIEFILVVEGQETIFEI